MKSRSTNGEALDREWQGLDPIFIMGRQRTGTSIMWRTLRAVNFLGFNEGHLWFDLVDAFARFRNPDYRSLLRQDIFALGADRNILLERRFALMMDRFHRELLPPEVVRWVDKSPGVHAVQVAPMLSELFPRAQFIFMKRNAITTVNSTVNYIGRERDLAAFRRTCNSWVRVMQAWRRVRHLLAGRYIEVEQEQVARRPRQMGREVADFLGVPQYAQRLGSVFASRRENSAFPEKEPGDYVYPVPWTDQQKTMLVDLCGEEMQVWGYPIDFQHPGGIDPSRADSQGQEERIDRTTYYRWVTRVTQGERAIRGEAELARFAQAERIARCEEELARLRDGRVMRALNWGEKVLRRLGLR